VPLLPLEGFRALGAPPAGAAETGRRHGRWAMSRRSRPSSASWWPCWWSSAAAYRVGEAEQVIITQFGEPVGDPVTEPGLHFKVPFIQQANYFEKRFLEWDGSPNQVPTKDKRFIWVDTYARWRIVDPLRFFQRLRDERGAQSRLDDILDGETRNAVARYDLIELVRSSNRNPDVPMEAEEEEVILNRSRRGASRSRARSSRRPRGRTRSRDRAPRLRIKRINYVAEVQKDVFARMIAERQRIAELFRSEGQGEAARIQGERERELQRIQSEAFRTAEELRGKADAEATDVYASAYGRDADFYASRGRSRPTRR
jgi:modulator of FtsH protease HflC